MDTIVAYAIARNWVAMTEGERRRYKGSRTVHCSDKPITYVLEDNGGVTSIFESKDGNLHVDPTFGYSIAMELEEAPDEDEPEWDEQYVFCSDCPPEECDGHCMSCYYR